MPMYAVKNELGDQFSGKNTVKPLIKHRSVNMNMAMYAPYGWTQLWYGTSIP